LQPGVPDELVAGQHLVVQGQGFTPGATVELWLYSVPRLLARGVAAPDGTIQLEVTIPADVAGDHHVVAFEPATGVGASQEIAVAEGALAFTGGEHTRLAFVGLLSVLVGVACMTIGRVRSRRLAVVRVPRAR
jgi:hypothetical protein